MFKPCIRLRRRAQEVGEYHILLSIYKGNKLNTCVAVIRLDFGSCSSGLRPKYKVSAAKARPPDLPWNVSDAASYLRPNDEPVSKKWAGTRQLHLLNINNA